MATMVINTNRDADIAVSIAAILERRGYVNNDTSQDMTALYAQSACKHIYIDTIQKCFITTTSDKDTDYILTYPSLPGLQQFLDDHDPDNFVEIDGSKYNKKFVLAAIKEKEKEDVSKLIEAAEQEYSMYVTFSADDWRL